MGDRAAQTMRGRVWLIAPALVGVVAVSPAAAVAQPGGPETALPHGRFYTQAGGDTPRTDDGFAVVDRVTYWGAPGGGQRVRFWDEFQRYGGVAVVGYPASQPFTWDDFTVQVFQKGVFQWRPEAGSDGQAWFMNVFDEFTRRGLDNRLLAEKQVPLPGSYDDSGKTFEQIRAERQALLAARPAFVRQYESVPDPLSLYGLANSAVQDFGPFYAIRLQRAAFQEWKVDVPGVARAGQVTVVNAGDVAKEFGLLPVPSAATPTLVPITSELVSVASPGWDDRAVSPFAVFGDAQLYEAHVAWELTDLARGDVLSRGYTMAASCCEWAGFQFEVPYAVSRDLRGMVSVYGPSPRDGISRLGEVRVPVQLSAGGRPAAAKDGVLLIQPLGADPEPGGGWRIRLRLRNESGDVLVVNGTDFRLRTPVNAEGVRALDSLVLALPAGESREVSLRFQSPSGVAVGDLRLLHDDQGTRPEAFVNPVVVSLPGGAPAGGDVPQAVLDAVIADAARRTGADAASVGVVDAEATDWSDGSLGCPQPGQVYVQVITPGYRIVVQAARRVLEYHAEARTGRFVLCAERPS